MLEWGKRDNEKEVEWKMQQGQRMQKERQQEILRRRKALQGGRPKTHPPFLHLAIISILCINTAAVWASSAAEGSCRHDGKESARIESVQREDAADTPSVSWKRDRKYREKPGL